MARNAVERPDHLQPSADHVQAGHPDARDADGNAVWADDLAASNVEETGREQCWGEHRRGSTEAARCQQAEGGGE